MMNLDLHATESTPFFPAKQDVKQQLSAETLVVMDPRLCGDDSGLVSAKKT